MTQQSRRPGEADLGDGGGGKQRERAGGGGRREETRHEPGAQVACARRPAPVARAGRAIRARGLRVRPRTTASSPWLEQRCGAGGGGEAGEGDPAESSMPA